MLWSIGFLMTFLFGGLTGVILASPPLDFHVSDSYFVVAHFHYVVFGTVVFAMFAGFYFWWPKMTGRMLDERLGKIHFWLLFIGFHTTFLVQHWLGVEGMPRRYADYSASDGFTTLNQVSTIGAFLLGLLDAAVPATTSTRRAGRRRSPSTTRGAGAARSSGRPAARRRGTTSSTIPRIRSESPAFDLHHPEIAALEYADNDGLGDDDGPPTPPTWRAAESQLGEEGRPLMKTEAWIFGDLQHLPAGRDPGVLAHRPATGPAPPRW